MPHPSCRLLAMLALLAGLTAVPDARAETYHTCEGFIDSVPAVISTQGVWCLRKNLTTGITSGAAITIGTNNVTIDCNGFKVGGLAAGDGSGASGIFAHDRQNTTVRHCNLRGFHSGIRIDGGAGHLIEDNRLDNNLLAGINVSGDGSLVQRNRVYDTGGVPPDDNGWSYTTGIIASGVVIDNTVAGVFGVATTSVLQGILLTGTDSLARNNRVSGLQRSGNGVVQAILTRTAGSNTIDGNQLIVPLGTSGAGISVISGDTHTVCRNNVIIGFSSAMFHCNDAGGNTSL